MLFDTAGQTKSVTRTEALVDEKRRFEHGEPQCVTRIKTFFPVPGI